MKNLTPRLNRIEPNIVIDGAMEIWPEGTSRSFTSGTGGYGAVLFYNYNDTSSTTITNSQQSSVPSGTSLQFSNRMAKTVAGTLAAGTSIGWRYQVEGYDLKKLMDNDFSVIFWVKSSVASNRSLSIRNAPSGFGSTTHSYVQQYSIDSANTWELKVKKFSKLSDCPGTLNRTNNIGIVLNWTAVGGTNSQTATLNQWISGSFVCGIGEDTTWLTGTNHDLSIAGVMILPGDWTALEASPSLYSYIGAGRNFQDELAMTQRYYVKTYPLEIPVGTADTDNQLRIRNFNSTNTGAVNFQWSFPVTMRADPSTTVRSVVTGAVDTIRDTTAGADIVATIITQGPVGMAAHNVNAVVVGNTYAAHMTADARF
jgi:hypothetical protein